MASKLRMLLGIEKPSDYVLSTMTRTNLDIIGYESILIAIVCALVSLSTCLPIVPWADKPDETVAVYRMGFAVTAILCVGFAIVIRHIRSTLRSGEAAAPFAMLLYIIVVMGMSMWLTVFDYGANSTFLAYVVALVLVFGLVYLPPFVTIAVIVVATAVMLVAMRAMGYNSPAYDLILIAYALLTIVVSTSGYHARLRATIANESVHEMSIRDGLTGARNRRALEGDARAFIGRSVYVLLGDIDEFKFYNDLFGHEAGDKMLVAFADSMRAAFGDDAVYRFGGDEFLVVVADGREERAFLDAVARWRDGFLGVESGGEVYSPTTSGGYVHGVPQDEGDFHEMLSLADIRLYEAKDAGGNVVFGATYDEGSAAKWMEKAARMRERNTRDSDPLTGLPSITYFYTHAKTIIDSPALEGAAFNIVYFNVENMKIYNERFGMAAGDALLVYTAQVIGESFEHSLVSRFGDDRFVMLTRADNLEAGLERVYESVRSFNPDSHTIIRAGVFPLDREIELNVACDRAKLACDHIKEHYNVYFCYYDESLVQVRDVKQFILDRFEEALEKGYIQVYYQPIMRTIDGRMSDLEALARWIDPEDGFISPGDFIPVLEELRLIHKLDLKVVDLVCADWRRFADSGRLSVPVNVNLSRYDIALCDIVGETTAIMERYGMPSDMLNIEMTESAFSENNELLSDVIARFHERGMQVWMDDFGSGYSSLNVLREFPFDVVKIDLRFLRHRDEKSRDRSYAMLRHVISMLKELSMQTLTEGIEYEEQFRFLQDIGCEKIQGFAYARPMPPDEVVKLVESGYLRPETAAQRRYSDAVGRVNLLTTAAMDEELGHSMELSNGFPAAIVQFRHGKVRYLAWNGSYLDYLRDIGMGTIENSANQMNDLSRPQSQTFHRAATAMKGKPDWLNLTFYEGEDLCTGMARCIAYDEGSDRCAFVYIAFNISSFLAKAGYTIPKENAGE